MGWRYGADGTAPIFYSVVDPKSFINSEKFWSLTAELLRLA